MSTSVITKIKEALARGQEIGAMIQEGFVYVYLGDKRDLWPALNAGLNLPHVGVGRSGTFTVSVVEGEDCLTLAPVSQTIVSSAKVGFGSVVLIEPAKQA